MGHIKSLRVIKEGTLWSCGAFDWLIAQLMWLWGVRQVAQTAGDCG